MASSHPSPSAPSRRAARSRTGTPGGQPPRRPPRARGRRSGPRALLAGGTAGNERLTVLTGVLLIVVLAGVGITILRIGQLLWLHLFLGLTVAGPIALKLASTGYRFTLYYMGERTYRRKGPPPTGLRLLAPLLVLTTFGVIATGVALLILGRHSSGPSLLLHKGFFIVWLGACGLHVLAHLPDLARSGAGARRTRRETFAAAGGAGMDAEAGEGTIAGGGARATALLISLLAGLALALSLTGLFHTWTG